MTYVATRQHFDNVMQAADIARQRKLGAGVAMLYDELCRKSWEDKTLLRLADFSPNGAAVKLDQDSLLYLFAHAECRLCRAHAECCARSVVRTIALGRLCARRVWHLFART